MPERSTIDMGSQDLDAKRRRRSLDELEGVEWGPPTYNSYLVTTCHRLREHAACRSGLLATVRGRAGSARPDHCWHSRCSRGGCFRPRRVAKVDGLTHRSSPRAPKRHPRLSGEGVSGSGFDLVTQ